MFVVEQDCPEICGNPALSRFVEECREQGWGYKRIWRMAKENGHDVGRDQFQMHCQHVERNVLSAIGDAEDRGEEVSLDWLARQGIDVPKDGDAVEFVAGTVAVEGPDGTSWIRVKPVAPAAEAVRRVEIRQAQPVEVVGDQRSGLTIHVPGDWRTWMVSPDPQVGYWLDSFGVWHTLHDERCFDLGHAVALGLAETEGLDGWLDVGDFGDIAAASRHNPTTIDLQTEGLNKTWERGSRELARRRWVVGPHGSVVVLGGNHDLRLRSKAQKEMPWLVGMKRAGDDEEFPVLSVPYLMRAKDYGVEWVPSFQNTYYKLNSNLCAFHSPAYGSKALDTARKIAAKVHMSVVHGHTHRREALAENIETKHGVRTMEIWSDGTWARIDGSVPAHAGTEDEYGNRMLASATPANVGVLSENWGQGFSIVHVEQGGAQRFAVERVAIWDGWCQFRGITFEAACDRDGNVTATEEAA